MNETVPILVADDEGEMRSLLGLILRSCGYPNILYASDGPSAIAALQSQLIQIAFIDINMPGEDGISVLKRARAIAPACFCVIVSAHSGLQNVRAAIAAGAKGFIVKPYTEQKIVDVLTKYERVVAAGS
jgi:two-component system, chemotaxis family, chemotaxis protein CheY